MAIQIETPSMEQGSLRKDLEGLKSYLHRTAQQLQWAFDSLESRQTETAVLPKLPQGTEISPRKSFENIKNLIIKSADIVDAYSGEIEKRLEGTYVAQSEFGTYREKTSQELQANSQELIRLFTFSSALSRDLQDLTAETLAAKAYIRTGKLTDAPTYGLEIGQETEQNGQKVFRKYARFTADRLSFFDGSDVEVAYISDYKLYITNAQVAGVLELGGRFLMNFDNGLIFKWTGGGAKWRKARFL